MINTHVAFKKLVENGMTNNLAKTITEILELQQSNIVTKNDLKIEMTQIRMEMTELRTGLNSRMDKMENDMSWLKAIGFIIIGLLIKIALFP